MNSTQNTAITGEGEKTLMEEFKKFQDEDEAPRVHVKKVHKSKYHEPASKRSFTITHNNGKPLVRRRTKIERNEQCPCGSGKKFKKCHGLTGENYYDPGR